MTSSMLSRLANAAHPASSTTYINPQFNLANTESEFSPSPTPERMMAVLAEPTPAQPPAPTTPTPTGSGPASGDYRFSVGKLPGWAKKQVEAGAAANAAGAAGPGGKGVDFPKGSSKSFFFFKLFFS